MALPRDTRTSPLSFATKPGTSPVKRADTLAFHAFMVVMALSVLFLIGLALTI
ncbi:MAG: hypothetical protein R3181_00545 [Rubricoccaceae bacterium]|nr:hypothetical protein [Rubricoccaceae bacterium]